MNNYAGFLNFLKERFQIRPLRDHERRRGNVSVCLLRHDVVDDLDMAIDMAGLELELGIKGTYFVSPSSKDFDIDKVRTILGMGHEIGLHNDILTRCLKSRRVGYARRLFEEELNIFKNEKIPIYGVSSMRSDDCAKYKLTNADVFKEYNKRGKPERVKHTVLFTLSLKKYHLYEAGLILSEHRFDDHGGAWNDGALDSVGIYPYLNNLSSSGYTTIQVIIHPSGWD